MKAKAEPRMMAIRIHLRSDCAQGVAPGVAPRLEYMAGQREIWQSRRRSRLTICKTLSSR